LTLAEFTEWLYLEIAGRYHHSIHRILGTTPAAAWTKSIARGTVPVLPADPKSLCDRLSTHCPPQIAAQWTLL